MSISSSRVNKPMDCPLTGLTVLNWSASTFSSASLSFSTRSTDTGTQLWLNDGAFTDLTVLEFVLSQPNKTTFPISWVSEPDGCSLFTGLSVLGNWVFDLGWVCWESSPLPATSEPNSFIRSSLKGNLWRRSRWRIYFLVFDFSSFHHNSFRDTTSWECNVKDDCVRSCLTELKSFLLSKFHVDPIHCVFEVSSTFSDCTKQDAVLPGQCYSDLCVLCS